MTRESTRAMVAGLLIGTAVVVVQIEFAHILRHGPYPASKAKGGNWKTSYDIQAGVSG